MGLFKPKDKIARADFAGTVEETGKGISHIKVGDKIFGETLEGGAFAEYVSAPAKVCGLMPPAAESSIMACVPIACLKPCIREGSHHKFKR